MSSYVLKIIACLSMFCDHFGRIFFGKTTFLNYIGRLAFPIFCFQIAQGYIHTRNIKKYILRLGLFAIISQIPFMIFYKVVFNSFAINVIFTLLFGLLAILVYDKYNKFAGFIVCIFLGLIAYWGNFDYGFFGVFIVFMFYILHNKKLYMTIVFAISVLCRYIFPLLQNDIPVYYLFLSSSYFLSVISTFCSIIPILLYNGQKGKDAKYLFYIFYPLHLLILVLIASFV